MSVARNCPYSDNEENCRYEIFTWVPRLNKCSNCERFLKKRFPNIDTSSYNIDENGNVLREVEGGMTKEELKQEIAELDCQMKGTGKDMVETDLATIAYMQGAERYKPKWHKVADGDLPKDARYVWTNVGAGYHDDDGWWDDFGRLQNVIAWCEPKFEE